MTIDQNWPKTTPLFLPIILPSFPLKVPLFAHNFPLFFIYSPLIFPSPFPNFNAKVSKILSATL